MLSGRQVGMIVRGVVRSTRVLFDRLDAYKRSTLIRSRHRELYTLFEVYSARAP